MVTLTVMSNTFFTGSLSKANALRWGGNGGLLIGSGSYAGSTPTDDRWYAKHYYDNLKPEHLDRDEQVELYNKLVGLLAGPSREK